MGERRQSGRENRRGREIELSERVCGSGMQETWVGTMNTKGKNVTKVTNISFKNKVPNVLLQISIYRIRKWRMIVRGRVTSNFCVRTVN